MNIIDKTSGKKFLSVRVLRQSFLVFLIMSSVFSLTLTNAAYGQGLHNQQLLKQTIRDKVDSYMLQWWRSGYDFADKEVLTLGNTDTIYNCIRRGALEIKHVEVWTNQNRSQAFYSHPHRLLNLRTWPENYSNNGNPDSQVLWHEVIHPMNMLCTPGILSYKDDHMYIEWAESAVRALAWLVKFEQVVKATKNNPTIVEVENGYRSWKNFLRDYNHSTFTAKYPTETEKGELTKLMGFDISPDKIRDNYLNKGYSPKFFATPVVPDLGMTPEVAWFGQKTSLVVDVKDLNGKPVNKGEIVIQQHLVWDQWKDIQTRPLGNTGKAVFEWTPDFSDSLKEKKLRVRVNYEGYRDEYGPDVSKEKILTLLPNKVIFRIKKSVKGKPTKQPIENAVIQVGGKTINAELNGTTTPMVFKPGKYALSLKAPGYKEITRQLILPLPSANTNSKVVNLDFWLEENDILELKEIILRPQNGIYFKTGVNTRKAKAFAKFSDNSEKEITKLKETEWKSESHSAGVAFDKKGELYIYNNCEDEVSVSASYLHDGKKYVSKLLIFKIHPDYVFTPWLFHEQKDTAIKTAEDHHFKPIIDYENVFNLSFASNVVTMQDPLQCSLVKKGSTIHLRINLDVTGKSVKVPDLIGLSSQETRKLLDKLLLFANKIQSQTYTKEVTVTIAGKTEMRQIKPSHVISQQPSAGKTVKPGAKVTYTLNYHRIPKMVKAPDLHGKTANEALSILSKLRLGLKDSLSSSFDSLYKPGVVIIQIPAKDKEVPVGTTVFVTINPSQPKLVKVPDLLCMTNQEAKFALARNNLGIQTNVASIHDSQCAEGEVIEQNPQKGNRVPVGTIVNVLINPPPKALIGIKIIQDKKVLLKNKGSYPLNTKLTFKEDVLRKNKNNKYSFVWSLNGKKTKGQSFTQEFVTPGRHRLTLDMISSDKKENDTISMNIDIEYPKPDDISCKIAFAPPITTEKPKYVEGDRITFIPGGKNIQKASEFQWYVNDRPVGRGRGVAHTFSDTGTYTVKLGLRLGSNFNEVSCTNNITINSGIGVLGKNRNRFKDKGAPEKLSVCSEYWVGGKGIWSPQCSVVSNIGPVNGHGLCTGIQSDGYNSGFLIYSSKGSEKLSFEVYRFSFNGWKGTVHYSGDIPKALNPDPDSLSMSCHANAVDIGWSNEDGSNCTTRIWKNKYLKYGKNYGVEKPTCSKPSVGQQKLRLCKKFAEEAVEQFDQSVRGNCNLQGPEWHGDLERHKQWCISVSDREANDLIKHRDDALKSCGKTWCDSYANRAVAQNKENMDNQCGFSGRRWQSDYNNHYNWCRSASKRSADSATRERDKELQNCTRGREGPCKQYAEKAVQQNESNLGKDCGFCGQRWQSSFNNHFNWCRKQPQGKQGLETKAREQLLRQCSGASTSDRKTFFEPCYSNYRLDNCLTFGVDCKKPAADRFCEQKGFTQATKWGLESARPTYIVDDGQLCDEEACTGFSQITCSGNKHPDNQNPVCSIKRPKSGLVVTPGQYVKFRADATDQDKDRLKYSWKFEGGRPDKWDSEQTSNATSQWKTPGTYTATLTVTDKKGGSCNDAVAITVKGKEATFDCDQYADKSVMQNEENLNKNCGFAGDLWHSGKSGHTNWCSNAGQGRAAQNIEARENALNDCKGATTIAKDLVCKITTPTTTAFPDAGKAVDFAGTAEGSSGSKFSFNWKFGEYGAQPPTSTKQQPGKVLFKWAGHYTATLTVTDASGQTCQATREVLVYDGNEPREFCEGYSGISIKQSEENIRNNCGYTGEHWHGEEFRHGKWCESVSPDEARSGLTDRDEKLRKCSGTVQQTTSLAGNWLGVVHGHIVSISQIGQDLTVTPTGNKGSVGWKRATGVVKKNTVYMNFDNISLTGTVSSNGNKISWSNNAIWTRQHSTGDIVPPDNPATDCGLGTRWDDETAGWKGVWIRRGQSNVFDANWTRGNLKEQAVLTVNIHGNTVDVKRKQVAGGSHLGQGCVSHGTIASDKVTVTGTVSCDWSPGPHTWKSTIKCDTPGNSEPIDGNEDTDTNGIKVVSATYGGNCGVTGGNVTAHVAGKCNTHSKCSYRVDHKSIGDPSFGCAKTYDVQYRCNNNPQVFKKSLEAEAGLGDKTVLLDCTNSPSGSTPSGSSGGGTARLVTVSSDRDIVGGNEAFRGNGKADALFRAQFSAPNRLVNAVQVSNTNGVRSVWETQPNNGLWLGGVVIGGRTMNRSDGSVNFTLGSGQNTLDFYVEDNGSIKGGRTNYRMTIFFASGDPLVMDIIREGSGPGSSSEPTPPASTKDSYSWADWKLVCPQPWKLVDSTGPTIIGERKLYRCVYQNLSAPLRAVESRKDGTLQSDVYNVVFFYDTNNPESLTSRTVRRLLFDGNGNRGSEALINIYFNHKKNRWESANRQHVRWTGTGNKDEEITNFNLQHHSGIWDYPIKTHTKWYPNGSVSYKKQYEAVEDPDHWRSVVVSSVSYEPDGRLKQRYEDIVIKQNSDGYWNSFSTHVLSWTGNPSYKNGEFFYKVVQQPSGVWTSFEMKYLTFSKNGEMRIERLHEIYFDTNCNCYKSKRI